MTPEATTSATSTFAVTNRNGGSGGTPDCADGEQRVQAGQDTPTDGWPTDSSGPGFGVTVAVVVLVVAALLTVRRD